MNELIWDDVRYFLVLSRQGSLSAAARFLQVEHTTVARRIKQLEAALSLKLFDRLPRGWVLTSEGKVLLEQANSLEERMLALQRAAHTQTSLAGTVRISTVPVLLDAFLVPHLDAFQKKYPTLELILMGELHLSDISRAEADIAVRIAEPTEPDVIARVLGEARYGLYGTPACLAKAENDQCFIGLDRTMSHLPNQRWLDHYAAGRRYVLRSNDLWAMLRAASLGWGLAVLPHTLINAQKDHGLLCFQEITALSRPVYLVMHADVRRAPRVRVMADFLIDVFQKHFDQAESSHA